MKSLIPALLTLPLFAVSCASPKAMDAPADQSAMATGHTMPAGAEGEMEMDPAMMEAMMSFMTPGEAHQAMATREGTWKVKSMITMGPGAESMPMEMVVEARMILDGHYLVEESSGMMMGMPYKGQLTMGFNNATEEWWTVYMDSMSTGFASCKGKADANGVVRMEGTMVDAMSPEGRPYRCETTITADEDNFVVHLFDTLPDGTEWEVMTMHYVRADK